jgi:hypothetical protein
MSDDAGDFPAEELRRRGVPHVIAKPFRLEQLTDVLRRLMNGVPTEPPCRAGCQGRT